MEKNTTIQGLVIIREGEIHWNFKLALLLCCLSISYGWNHISFIPSLLSLFGYLLSFFGH